ncbi:MULTISPECIES: chemotaxis protein CheW [unclassified Fusibacter]|uniref:chemotaxis protein CheW n=1 Tax=unclassified Fusibacter TaxID=2624464 RepID=UPI001012E123|nr:MULTISPECIES: chemotaxis protein CheW [unclassified Fusibacter]MCK8060403.1 chemotaxis protein CheW [Fusibacter sp. A2]NPE20308.1 purine-binding chemotaxis protein CheW [Fusibacter sp. A1]RXV63514.1 chemotaxis protein CheW [Fusibacter sp. A1]
MTQENNMLLLEEEDTIKGKYLTFDLEEEVYGLEIEYVTEIIGILPITIVPDLPEYIRGIINLRGRIIPVMDMRLRFNKEFVQYNERTCIVVIDMKDYAVGLIVDSVSEVTTILEEDIVEQPMLSTGTNNRYIKSLGKVEDHVKLLLDCERLLNEENFSQLTS